MTWRAWKWPLATQILAGLALGIAAGVLARQWLGESASLRWALEHLIQPVGSVFLRLIFMMVIPLIVSAIILGVTQFGDLRRLGRVGLRCLGITIGLAASSVLIGLLLVNLIEPGKRISESRRAELVAQYQKDATEKIALAERKKPLSQVLLELIPVNPLAEATHAFSPNYTGGGILAVMVFSLFVGLAMAWSEPPKVRTLAGLLEGLFTVALKIIGFAMRIAPVGVACLGFAVAARLGLEVVTTLGLYVIVVVTGLMLQQFAVYPLVLWGVAQVRPGRFFAAIQDAMAMAFSTASSNATLPTTLRVAEENLKLPPHVSRFVLTVGSNANQNGTALYEGVTVLFLAQVFGVELDLAQQGVVALMCVLAGIGTAGVPGGSLPLVVGVLVTVGVPGESIALILGVDRFLDMCRTTLNVTGDLVCATVVARQETAP